MKATSNEKDIDRDVRNDARINELKILRNRGVLTPEVVAMCEKHIDELAETAISQMNPAKQAKVTAAVAAVKASPADLAMVCQFSDAYEEVMKWNALQRQGVIPPSVTCSHREMDIALFDSICDKWRSSGHTYGICIMCLCNVAAKGLRAAFNKAEAKKDEGLK